MINFITTLLLQLNNWGGVILFLVFAGGLFCIGVAIRTFLSLGRPK